MNAGKIGAAAGALFAEPSPPPNVKPAEVPAVAGAGEVPNVKPGALGGSVSFSVAGFVVPKRKVDVLGAGAGAGTDISGTI